MKFKTVPLLRHFSTSTTIKPQICVVGSGPAGFYAADFIAKRLTTAQIDILEKLPVPFGSIRYGVAPDRSNLKNCINQFTRTVQNRNVKFIGNINLGNDVSLKELKKAYHAVILTYGVDDSHKFDIKGNDLKNVIQAKDFVGWYNGVPRNKHLSVDLSGSTATIFGHGNVAIDVARLLLTPVDELKTTDITEYALAILSQSNIKQVSLVGRRGPLHASFTTKALRDFFSLKDCCTIWRSHDLYGLPELVPHLAVPRKRLSELILEQFHKRQKPKPNEKQVSMTFLRSPVEFRGSTKIGTVKLGINRLEIDDWFDEKAILTNDEETIDTSLVVTSIGYKSVQADEEIPFDKEKCIVKNTCCKVEDGLYTAGWVAKGANGVLVRVMHNAFSVANFVIKDLHAEGGEIKPGFEHVKKILDGKNVQMVTWKDWLKIDEFEKAEGRKVNKPREKVADVEEMLKIAAA